MSNYRRKGVSKGSSFEYLRFRKALVKFVKSVVAMYPFELKFSVLSSLNVAIMGRLMPQWPGCPWTRWASLTWRNGLCGNTRPLWTRYKKKYNWRPGQMWRSVLSALSMLLKASTVSDGRPFQWGNICMGEPLCQAGINTSHILLADCIFRRVSLKDMTNPSIRGWRRAATPHRNNTPGDGVAVTGVQGLYVAVWLGTFWRLAGAWRQARLLSSHCAVCWAMFLKVHMFKL